MSADVRKLLAASRKSRRITSPYASYSLAGALFCNICNNTPVKSESLWDAHVSSAQHKANVVNKTVTAGGRKSNKRPAETAVEEESTPDVSTRNGNTKSNKRLKTAGSDIKNLALPVGFFDDDDDEEQGIVSNGEAIEPDDDEEVPATTTTSTSNQTSNLPSDFFSSTSKHATTQGDGLEDEWAAFQAEIAKEPSQSPPPTNNHNTIPSAANYTISAPAVSASQLAEQNDLSKHPVNSAIAAEDELEEARSAMADFFEEQSNLESRVQKLKERREMLRKFDANNNISSSTVASIPSGGNPEIMQLDRSNSLNSAGSVSMGGMDENASPATGDAYEADEDTEDDDDMTFFRRR